MAKRSYVWINGALHEKVSDNTVIIGGQNWHCYGGSWQPEGEAATASYMVMGDIEPYRSTITGEIIPSRSRHREHLRDHNCIEMGNDRPPARRPDDSAFKNLRQELIARFNS